MPGAIHGRALGLVWPDEDSHSVWTGFRGPRHGFWGPRQRHQLMLSCGRRPASIKKDGHRSYEQADRASQWSLSESGRLVE